MTIRNVQGNDCGYKNDKMLNVNKKYKQMKKVVLLLLLLSGFCGQIHCQEYDEYPYIINIKNVRAEGGHASDTYSISIMIGNSTTQPLSGISSNTSPKSYFGSVILNQLPSEFWIKSYLSCPEDHYYSNKETKISFPSSSTLLIKNDYLPWGPWYEFGHGTSMLVDKFEIYADLDISYINGEDRYLTDEWRTAKIQTTFPGGNRSLAIHHRQSKFS
ncbi:hypothetical protein FACS189413_18230 [Bacteroidia bacterium]|nr:hypothetical protein FACS189413_18230 [Bacteroidia bacterium]